VKTNRKLMPLLLLLGMLPFGPRPAIADGTHLTAFAGDTGKNSDPYDWVFDPASPFLSTDAGRQFTIYGGRGPLPDGTYTVGNVNPNFVTPLQGTQTIVTTTVVPAAYQVPGTGGGLWVYGTTIPAATSAIIQSDPVLTVGVARSVTVSFNGTFTGTVTPSLSGAAGTFSPTSMSITAASSATFTLTLSAPGPQNNDGMGSATLSASLSGTTPPTVSPTVNIPVAPATTAPTATNLTAAWKGSLDALFAGGKVYNSRYDARLPFALWGDGVTDSLAAINADSSWISAHGGGVLYLPAGNYPTASTSTQYLQAYNNVLITGDTNLLKPIYISIVPGGSGQVGANSGQVRTVLGYSTAANYGFVFNGVSNSALMNLTVRNIAPLASQHNYLALYSQSTVNSIALDGVEWVSGDDGGLQFQPRSGFAHLAVENSRLDTSADTGRGAGQFAGTLLADNWTDLSIANNWIRYPRGRIRTPFVVGGYVRGNELIRTIPLGPGNFESGGIEASYDRGTDAAHPFLIEYNLIAVDGPVDQENFGEPVNFQADDGKGDFRNFRDVGSFSSVNFATHTYTDSSKTWSLTPAHAELPNINGWQTSSGPLSLLDVTPGSPLLGQYETIISHDATTVTTSGGFTQAPAPGDQYSIVTWTALSVTVQNNVIYNNFHATLGGFGLYSGGDGCKFLNNAMVNSGGIELNGIAQGSFHCPVWNNVVSGNTISNPNGLMLSFLGISYLEDSSTLSGLHGNLSFGNTFVANHLTPAPASSTATNSPLGFGPPHADGVFNSLGPGSPFTLQPIAMQQAALNVLSGRNVMPGLTYTTGTLTGGLPIPAAVSAAASGGRGRTLK